MPSTPFGTDMHTAIVQIRRNSGLRFRTNRLIALALLFGAALVFGPRTGNAQTGPRGFWQLRYDSSSDRVQLSFDDYNESPGHHSSTSFGVDASLIQGLTKSQLSDGQGPVQFRLVRDAGAFTFSGEIDRGRGNGRFDFIPDPRFAQELAKRGYERPSAEQQFELGLHDMGYAVVDELKAQGYNRPSVDDLVTMGMHGVRLDYLRGLSGLGYRVGRTEKLVELRDHGVTPTFISGLASAGYSRLTADDLVELRDHGVTPSYLGGLSTAGYTRLAADDLRELRDHGVTASMADGFRRLGYSRLSLRDLVRLRDHGVTLSFAQRERDRSGDSLTVDELIRRRDRGDRY
jgi:hypothetical protein